jgi:hypothetical protein
MIMHASQRGRMGEIMDVQMACRCGPGEIELL